MRTIPFRSWRGLDARPGIADDPKALTRALNVVLRSDRTLERRPALVHRVALPADSAGLYAVGDSLRTLARYDAGDETADDNLAPTLAVDYITAGQDVAEVLGSIADSAGNTLALVRYADASTALHHCPEAGVPPVGDTALGGLGFSADFALVRAAGRAWTLDANLRNARYSAVDGATPASLDNWTPGEDANAPNFLQVAQHAAGAGRPQALGLFGARLVVAYRSALLVYVIDTDQERIYLEQALAGPGTIAPRSLASVVSDLVMLTPAGVRPVSSLLKALDADDDPVFGLVDPLAMALADQVGVVPVGHFARRLGCYLLAFGQDVLCLSLVPGSSVLGWTLWRLPVAVDAMAEAQGLTWVRSGTDGYAFDRTADRDALAGGEVPVPVLVETAPTTFPGGATAEQVGAVLVEPARVQVLVDGRPGVDAGGMPMGRPLTLAARAPEPTTALVSGYGRSMAVRVYDEDTTAAWRLSGVWLGVSA